ncbi:hypothetical protein PoB_006657000 [Plakobranchus ocellatus]|uniref:Uncharacterized protein n=1 Tax=Plakobranchus ocellatus TaxID=259542 RepID=A0AAV4D7V5_9GAST|nr:hypothetical protein PoB_006657000 [Plakobranchus ocellatus]
MMGSNLRQQGVFRCQGGLTNYFDTDASSSPQPGDLRLLSPPSGQSAGSGGFEFLYIASPQQGDLRLSGPPSGQGAGSGARTRDRRVPADLRESDMK